MGYLAPNQHKMKRFLLLALTFFMAIAIVDDACSQTRRDQRRREREIRRNLRTQQNYRGETVAFLPPSQRRIGIGISLNSFNYFGDLAPSSSFASTDISFTRPGVGFYATYRAISNRIDLDAAFTWGTLRGADSTSSSITDPSSQYNFVRNLSFRNQIFELSAGARIYLFEDGRGTLQRKKLNPYAFIGAGVFIHNPKTQVPEMDIINNYDPATKTFNPQPITTATHGAEPGDWVPLRKYRTEGQGLAEGVNTYSLVSASIIGGIGVRYRLANYLDLSFDINIRYLFNDHLDDVSGNYVDLGLLGEGPDGDLARVLSDRSLETLAQFGGTIQAEYFEQLYGQQFQEYTSAGNNKVYAILPGRGRSSELNKRGNPSNDIFYVAAFKLTYILGGTLTTSNQFR